MRGTPIPSPTPIPMVFDVATDGVAVLVGDVVAESVGAVLDEPIRDVMVVVLTTRVLLCESDRALRLKYGEVNAMGASTADSDK